MKSTLTLLTLLLLLSRAESEDGYVLSITVTKIPAAKGNLLVGLYDDPASFTGRPLPQSPKIPVTSTEDVKASIENLQPGTYAVAVIQDLNGNGELDRNFLGMPTEPLAFSVIARIPKGKPGFEACSFEIKDADVSMTIPLILK